MTQEIELQLEENHIQIFSAGDGPAPLVLLHTVNGEGWQVYDGVRACTTSPFSLTAIDGLDWHGDMSPWPAPPLSAKDTPFSGGAVSYLARLEEKILPEIRSQLSFKPSYLALAGYSLAGLFAIHAMYCTAQFSRIACVSGSLWYPELLSFVRSNELKGRPDAIYFSLGEREARTKNRLLGTVEENTRILQAHYEEIGIKTVLEMNPGNHFNDAVGRMARGISWILQAQ